MSALAIKERFTKSEVNRCSDYAKEIYPNKVDECFMRILTKNIDIIGMKFKPYPIQAMHEPFKVRQIQRKFGREDLFMSLNTLKTMKSGRKGNVFAINNIAVDVDYKKEEIFEELEPWQIIKLLEWDHFDKTIPTPNYIEFSNQIRLIYCVETAYVPKYKKNVVVLSDRISQVFAEQLSDYGAEKQGVESYIRIPGSINSKNNSIVQVIDYNIDRHVIRDIQEIYMDEALDMSKRRKGRRKATNKLIKLHNVYALNTNRLRDFEKVRDYYVSIGVNDFRARLCFLYRNYVLIQAKYQNGKLTDEDFERAEKLMLEFNKGFIRPLPEHQIEGRTRNVNGTQYLYKNETLVDFLELTYELCEELGLDSIYKVKTQAERDKEYREKHKEQISKKRKNNYRNKLNEAGKLSEEDRIAQRRAKIKDLLAKGLKKKDILSTLDISESTYKRDRKFLKEEGLI